HDPATVENAVRGAFERLGGTGLAPGLFTFRNDAGCFVPVSRLNQVRRDLVADLEESQRRQRAERVARVQAAACPPSPPSPLGGEGLGVRGSSGEGERARNASTSQPPHPRPLSPEGRGEKEGFRWSLKVDRIHFLDALEDSDLAGVEEIIID